MARMNLSKFLREQWTPIPPVKSNAPSVSVQEVGKTIIVTGSTNGLGIEAAKQLHRLSPASVGKLILTSRDLSKVKEAEKFVTENSTQSRCQWEGLDLASFSSVSAFVDSLDGEKVNCLLVNAALATHKYTETQDGWESALQVNYLSNALLTILLLPNLIDSLILDASRSRIVLVSSDAHYSLPSLDDFRNAPNILEAVNRKEYCTSAVMKQRTMLSKLFVIAFTRELARRLPIPAGPTSTSAAPAPKGIVISSINPGFCHSKLTRETEAHFPGNLWLPTLKYVIARPTEVGAAVLVRATLMEPIESNGSNIQKRHDADLQGLEEKWHGRYLSSCLDVSEESDLLLGEDGKEFSRKLWVDTINVLEKVDLRVKKILGLYDLNSSH